MASGVTRNERDRGPRSLTLAPEKGEREPSALPDTFAHVSIKDA